MIKVFVSSSFSFQMLPSFRQNESGAQLNILPVKDPEAFINDCKERGFYIQSAINHEPAAKVISNELKFDLPFNRSIIKLQGSDILFFAHFTRGKLQEDAETLPNGMNLQFFAVEIGDVGEPLHSIKDSDIKGL